MMTKHISVAEAKRRFADVLGEVRYRGERFVIERNGTPMAALVPLEAEGEAKRERPEGFLALVGAFEDAPDYPDVLTETVGSRKRQRSRRAPTSSTAT